MIKLYAGKAFWLLVQKFFSFGLINENTKIKIRKGPVVLYISVTLVCHSKGKSSIQQEEDSYHQQTGHKFK
jgi:hypothetical protein